MRVVFGKTFLFFLLLSVLLGAALPGHAQESLPAWRYTVKPGDSLISIAERYLLHPSAWPRIQRDSKIADPYRIPQGTVLYIPANLLRQTPGEAILERVSGQVRWHDAHSSWQAVTQGQRLAAGAWLETGEASSALLVLADGSKIVVSPNAQLSLDSLSLYAGGLMADTRMRLQRGQAEVMADPARRGNQHLRIQTPSAQAVVRGTRFRVSAAGDATREETLDGLVSLSAQGRSVSVSGGQGALARTDEPPSKPVRLLPAADTAGFPARFERLPLRFRMPTLVGAAAWYGQIAPDKSFDTILLDKSVPSGNLSFSDLPNGDYVLRLRAVDANGLQGMDTLHAFTVFARPFPPGLNFPGDAAKIRTARPTLAWGKAVGVSRYRVQLAGAPDFAALLYDEIVEGNHWLVPDALPAGPFYWRAASLGDSGEPGPWNLAAFTYLPEPGPVDLGRSALAVDAEKLVVRLPPPSEGLYYEAFLSSDQAQESVLKQARSDDGFLEIPQPGAGDYYLGIRLVDRSDNTPGPTSVQAINIPSSRLWLLLLLVPVALAL